MASCKLLLLVHTNKPGYSWEWESSGILSCLPSLWTPRGLLSGGHTLRTSSTCFRLKLFSVGHGLSIKIYFQGVWVFLTFVCKRNVFQVLSMKSDRLYSVVLNRSKTSKSKVKKVILWFILNPLLRSEQGYAGPHRVTEREREHWPGEQQDLRHRDGMLLSTLTLITYWPWYWVLTMILTMILSTDHDIDN